MLKFFIKLTFLSLISSTSFTANKLNALVPYHYYPSSENLKREALSLGKSAYQLLYFGKIKDSLKLAKLAIEINQSDEKLWAILAEAQIANNLYTEALISLNKAQELNSTISELYFAKSSIYLKQSKVKKAKFELLTGLKLEPKNFNGIFQLGNIFLIEKNYEKAINEFEKAVLLKPDFWQAINNKGLAYYELNKIKLAIPSFKKAIRLEENAESLLALASALQEINNKESILLAKKALLKDPNYVEYKYRKDQLWGERLQVSTENLLKSEELKEEVIFAKTKINKTS